MAFEFAQTFYMDPAASQNSDKIFITSIELYFYAKPVVNKTVSGISKPGVSIYVTTTKDDGTPDLSTLYQNWVARREYDDINVSTVGEVATKFIFNQPVPIDTGRSGAFLVKFDGQDTGFELWYNKAGQVVLGSTTKTQTSSGKIDGYMYTFAAGTETGSGPVLTPMQDADLSFKLNVAYFTANTADFKLVNNPYEIIKSYIVSGTFKGGEQVYQQNANAAGSIAITANSKILVGNGTSFSTTLTSGDQFVIVGATSNTTAVRVADVITNATYMTITEPAPFTSANGHYYRAPTGKLREVDLINDLIYVQNITSNSSVYILPGQTLYGVDSGASALIDSIVSVPVNAMTLGYTVGLPAGTTVNTFVNFANSSNIVDLTKSKEYLNGIKANINQQSAIVASRTTEVTTGTQFRSIPSTMKFSTQNPYVSPWVREDTLDLFADTYNINNDDTNEYLGTGNSKARYISKPVTIPTNQLSEDLRVYVRAFKPSNTSIKAYGRFRNLDDGEDLQVKQWTELTPDNIYNQTSSKSDPANTYLEIGYSVPQWPVGSKVDGTFTTTLSSAVVTGTTTTVNTSILTGDVVRVYSSAVPNTYFVGTVTASNTTTFTLASAVSNTSLVASGLYVDKVTRKNSAFLDIQGSNVLSYYNTSLALFKGYDTFQVKLVLLTSDGISIPFIDDVRAIAVSA